MRAVTSFFCPSVKQKRFDEVNLRKNPISVAQLNCAELLCIQSVQHYSKLYWHIFNLKGKPCVSVKKEYRLLFSPLKSVNVFCDNNSILRIHGRIINSDVTYDKKKFYSAS